MMCVIGGRSIVFRLSESLLDLIVDPKLLDNSVLYTKLINSSDNDSCPKL